MATVRLTWTDLNSGALQEDEILIYRADAPFDIDTLPTPMDTLAADTVTYDDTTAVDDESYWYAVAMVKGDLFAISFTGEVIATPVLGFSDATTYVVTCSGPDRDAHQGVVALPGGGWVLVFNNTLRRYNADWVEQAQNTDPMGDISAPGNMIDMFEQGGYLWNVRTNSGTTDYINAWDATTLSYSSGNSVPFTAGPSFVGFSAVSDGPVTGRLYGVQQNATVIEVHNMATGAHIEDISIGGTLSNCNGLKYADGWFYFAERPNDLRRCLATGGGLETVLEIGSFTGMDGLSLTPDGLGLEILMDNSWDGLLRVNAIFGAAAQTTGESSGELVVNGDAETSDMTGWLNNNNLIVNIFSGALGAKPDSRVFRGTSGGYMYQSVIFPPEGWDSVDAGTATGDLEWQQVGTSNASCSMTFFDEQFTQLGQAYYSLSAPGFSAWVDRGGTGAAVPVGTRMVLIGVHTSGTNTQIDNISAELHW